MDFVEIIKAVKEIGLLPVMVILFILFQFRTIVRLEKYNEMLIKFILEMKRGDASGFKINNRDNSPRIPDSDSN